MAASGAGEDQRVLLESLCAAAWSAWVGRLREGVEPGDCGEALVCAAALTAASHLAAGSGGVASFSAGDLSVRLRDTGAEDGACLRRAAEALRAPYAQAADLWVKGVEG